MQNKVEQRRTRQNKVEQGRTWSSKAEEQHVKGGFFFSPSSLLLLLFGSSPLPFAPARTLVTWIDVSVTCVYDLFGSRAMPIPVHAPRAELVQSKREREGREREGGTHAPQKPSTRWSSSIAKSRCRSIQERERERERGFGGR